MDVQGMQVLRGNTSNMINSENPRKEQNTLYFTPKKVKDNDNLRDTTLDSLHKELYHRQSSPLSEIQNCIPPRLMPDSQRDSLDASDLPSIHRSKEDFFLFNHKELLKHHDSVSKDEIQDLNSYSPKVPSNFKNFKNRWSENSCETFTTKEPFEFSPLPSSISPRRYSSSSSSFKVPEIFSNPSRISENFESLLRSFKQI